MKPEYGPNESTLTWWKILETTPCGDHLSQSLSVGEKITRLTSNDLFLIRTSSRVRTGYCTSTMITIETAAISESENASSGVDSLLVMCWMAFVR